MNWASARCRRATAALHDDETAAGDLGAGREIKAAERSPTSTWSFGAKSNLRGVAPAPLPPGCPPTMRRSARTRAEGSECGRGSPQARPAACPVRSRSASSNRFQSIPPCCEERRGISALRLGLADLSFASWLCEACACSAAVCSSLRFASSSLKARRRRTRRRRGSARRFATPSGSLRSSWMSIIFSSVPLVQCSQLSSFSRIFASRPRSVGAIPLQRPACPPGK